MSFLTKSDYARESKKNKIPNRRRSKYHGGLQIAKKVRLPTQLKSKKLYCHNCLVQIEANGVGKPCKQCGKITVSLTRRY